MHFSNNSSQLVQQFLKHQKLKFQAQNPGTVEQNAFLRKLLINNISIICIKYGFTHILCIVYLYFVYCLRIFCVLSTYILCIVYAHFVSCLRIFCVLFTHILCTVYAHFEFCLRTFCVLLTHILCLVYMINIRLRVKRVTLSFIALNTKNVFLS